MRILYVTPEISWPLSFGGEIRRWNILQGLLQAGETDAVVFHREEQMVEPALAGCKHIFAVSDRHLRFSTEDQHRYNSTLGRSLLALRSRLPFEYQGADQDDLRVQLQSQIEFKNYDLVWFSGARVASAIGHSNASDRITVLDGDDFSYMREGMLLRASPWYGAKIWNYLDIAKLWWLERRLATQFSFVIRCSQEDRNRHPADNIIVIPNGTDIPAEVERAPQCRVLFIGDLGYAPNQQGIEWFLDQVWPLIRRHVQDAKLDIVGRKASPAVQQANGKSGVVVHGFVNNLDALYRTASVSVVPLHAGGGTRLKILESLARCVPVISTTIGAFGIDIDSQQGLQRADSPEEFAACCAAALRHGPLDQPPIDAGREFVRTHYDWMKIQQQVAGLAARAAATGKATR